jgi:hypothetical protein
MLLETIASDPAAPPELLRRLFVITRTRTRTRSCPRPLREDSDADPGWRSDELLLAEALADNPAAPADLRADLAATEDYDVVRTLLDRTDTDAAAAATYLRPGTPDIAVTHALATIPDPTGILAYHVLRRVPANSVPYPEITRRTSDGRPSAALLRRILRFSQTAPHAQAAAACALAATAPGPGGRRSSDDRDIIKLLARNPLAETAALLRGADPAFRAALLRAHDAAAAAGPDAPAPDAPTEDWQAWLFRADTTVDRALTALIDCEDTGPWRSALELIDDPDGVLLNAALDRPNLNLTAAVPLRPGYLNLNSRRRAYLDALVGPPAFGRWTDLEPALLRAAPRPWLHDLIRASYNYALTSEVLTLPGVATTELIDLADTRIAGRQMPCTEPTRWAVFVLTHQLSSPAARKRQRDVLNPHPATPAGRFQCALLAAAAGRSHPTGNRSGEPELVTLLGQLPICDWQDAFEGTGLSLPGPRALARAVVARTGVYDLDPAGLSLLVALASGFTGTAADLVGLAADLIAQPCAARNRS